MLSLSAVVAEVSFTYDTYRESVHATGVTASCLDLPVSLDCAFLNIHPKSKAAQAS